LPGIKKSDGLDSNSIIALGEALDGRLAFVVFRRLRAGMIRVITARDREDKERRMFRRK